MFTRSQLVSFGNFLLKGKKEVTHADVENWVETIPSEPQTLPCSHQDGDFVSVTFFEAGIIKNCKVNGIYFKQGHIFYDLLVMTHQDDDGKENYQRLYRVPQGLLDKEDHSKIDSPE